MQWGNARIKKQSHHYAAQSNSASNTERKLKNSGFWGKTAIYGKQNPVGGWVCAANCRLGYVASLNFLVPLTGKGGVGVPHKRPNAVTATFYCNLSVRKTLRKDAFPYFLNHSVKVCKRQNQFVKLCQIMTRAQTIYQFFCPPIT